MNVVVVASREAYVASRYGEHREAHGCAHLWLRLIGAGVFYRGVQMAIKIAASDFTAITFPVAAFHSALAHGMTWAERPKGGEFSGRLPAPFVRKLKENGPMRKAPRVLFVWLFLLVYSAQAYSQESISTRDTINDEQVQKIIHESRLKIQAILKNEMYLPGLAVTLVSRDRILWTEGFGYRDKCRLFLFPCRIRSAAMGKDYG